MIQENLRTDDLPTVFRALSVRKKHGVLTVQAGRERFDIIFCAGKISGCERRGEHLASGVLSKLVQSGVLDETFADSLEVESFDDLILALVKSGRMEREVLFRARQVYELGLLHSIRHIEHPQISFSPQIMTPDELAVLDISPGQFLLDLVEIDADEERFREIFFSDDGVECLVGSINEAPPPGGRAVHEVWKKCREYSSISDILRKTLLTNHETCAALLALYDQHALTIEKREIIDSRAPSFPKKIDDASFLGALEEEFGEFDSDEDDLNEFESVPEMTSSAEFARDEAEFEPMELQVVSTQAAPQSFLDRLKYLNLVLQEESGRQTAALAVAFVVLSAVGFVLPEKLQGIFDALLRISSAFESYQGGLGQ